ncbi:MAG: aldehyde dehydrogenase [Lachnospiraceae bacterium]|nr:aldehyde dehydrogenase [Lachnospiraceae bacterium]
MEERKIRELVENQRAYFLTGKTKSVKMRLAALERLEQAIKEREKEIHEALKKDLNKDGMESYMTETGMTYAELSYVKKHLRRWAAPHTVMTPLSQFHAKSFSYPEPYGVVLVMSPWNYPFMLTMEPLIGAIAAGNCCIVKPSAYSPNVSRVICELIRATFPKQYIAAVEGGREENTALLEQRFDYIFFTGGVRVGRQVMEKAAAHLTPVTLELGGKSPCIVDHTADLRLAAKRIVFGKFLNCGQTCVAPDYLLVQEDVKVELTHYLIKYMKKMYGTHPLENEKYPKMINQKHFDRVCGLMSGMEILAGGTSDRKTLKIAPTLLDHVTENDPVMQEEIFGPVLPILTFRNFEEAVQFVQKREKPLALYLFTNDKETENRVLRDLSFGGGCINDTIIHLATSYLGFGGVGESGMGSYHGKNSFLTFSHQKSVVKKYNWIDLPMRYQPYSSWKERMVRMFLK